MGLSNHSGTVNNRPMMGPGYASGNALGPMGPGYASGNALGPMDMGPGCASGNALGPMGPLMNMGSVPPGGQASFTCVASNPNNAFTNPATHVPYINIGLNVGMGPTTNPSPFNSLGFNGGMAPAAANGVPTNFLPPSSGVGPNPSLGPSAGTGFTMTNVGPTTGMGPNGNYPPSSSIGGTVAATQFGCGPFASTSSSVGTGTAVSHVPIGGPDGVANVVTPIIGDGDDTMGQPTSKKRKAS